MCALSFFCESDQPKAYDFLRKKTGMHCIKVSVRQSHYLETNPQEATEAHSPDRFSFDTEVKIRSDFSSNKHWTSGLISKSVWISADQLLCQCITMHRQYEERGTEHGYCSPYTHSSVCIEGSLLAQENNSRGLFQQGLFISDNY